MTGDAGLGKSAVIRTVVSRLREQTQSRSGSEQAPSLLVLVAQSSELLQAISFSTVRQWLRRWTRALSPAAAAARALEVAGISDATHAAAAAGLRALVGAGDGSDGAVSIEEKAAAFAQVLAAMARRQKLVLVVEDAGPSARNPLPRAQDITIQTHPACPV